MRAKLLLLFSLYFCQGLPGGFLAVVLPVMLREQGYDLRTIGFAQVLSLPWLLKVLWAPLVDRYGSARFGRRKSWLLPAQAGMLLVTLSFVGVHPEHSLWAVLVLFAVLNLLAATQDIAVDGLAVDLLEPHEMGPGNATQVGGFKLGNLFGGGVLLALSGVVGWAGDFLIMSGCIALAMILVVRVREPAPPVPSTRTTAQLLRDLWGSVRSQGPWLWLFLAYAKFGETLGGALVKPMLVDLEFSRSFIGLIDGVFGSVATIAGAGLGGWLSQRHSWALTITAFTVIQGLALAQLGIAQASGVGVVGIASLLVVENFAGGGVAVGIFALAMSRCDRDVGASQFTMAQVVYMSGALLAAPLGGWVADITGYLPVMVLSGGLALLLAPVALVMRRRLRAPAT